MVVFTCSLCGQSVKKNQVETHCNYQCRNCESLACMDCGKVFWGDDYKEHTKCITEDQKYGGKDYQAKPSSNKGEVKQEKWTEHIKKVISTKKLSGPLKGYLEQIVLYSNIPRKKSKFENFLKNSLKLRNSALISEAWEIFAQSTSVETKPNEAPNPTAVNGIKRHVEYREEIPAKRFCSNETSINGSQKRHTDDREEIPAKRFRSNETSINSSQKRLLDSKGEIPTSIKISKDFRWEEVIESVLLGCLDNTMDMRSLRKLVAAQYKNTVKNSTLSKNDMKSKIRETVENSDIFIVIKTKQ